MILLPFYFHLVQLQRVEQVKQMSAFVDPNYEEIQELTVHGYVRRQFYLDHIPEELRRVCLLFYRLVWKYFKFCLFILSLMSQDYWALLTEKIEEDCESLQDLYIFFETLSVIARNLLRGNEKHRKLNVMNSRLQEKVFTRVGGYEFVNAMGFELEDCLVCKNVDRVIIEAAIKELDFKIDILKPKLNPNTERTVLGETVQNQ